MKALIDTSPPIAVTAITIAGYSLPDIVLFATLIYTVLRVIFLLWDRFHGKKDGKYLGDDH